VKIPFISSKLRDPVVCRHGRIALASQPTEADLDTWAADGTGLVVNSRTPEETAGLPFDLAGAVAERGMQYAELPIGGPYGASPELTVRLGALLEADPDRGVVLHCRSGTRSAHLYAAWLMASGEAPDAPFDTMGWPGSRDMAMVQALLPAASA
jgi:uncharacterized protein (TIGR01244 family)